MNQRAGVESLGADTSTRLKEPYVGAAELKDKRLALSVDQVPFRCTTPTRRCLYLHHSILA